MEYRGIVRSGIVVLDNGVADLPDGTQVRVTPVDAPQSAKAAAGGENAPRVGSLRELLLKFAGRAQGLPSDMSRNHDHYIHGTPRE